MSKIAMEQMRGAISRPRVAVFILACASVLPFQQVLAATPLLLPVPGLFGLPAADAPAGSSGVDPNFLAAIGRLPPGVNVLPDGAEKYQLAIEKLKTKMQSDFGDQITQKITTRSKNRTFAVSMQVTRALVTCISKPGGVVQVNAPLSASLYFTNIMSGDVLYSVAQTTDEPWQLDAKQYDCKPGSQALSVDVQKGFVHSLDKLIDGLVTTAKKEFQPFERKAKVVESWNGYYVLDAGIQKGVGRGAELVSEDGSGLRIVHSDTNYSVATLSLGEVKDKAEFAFYGTATSQSLSKPKALVLDVNAPSYMGDEYVTLQFAENIGTQASFSLITVNHSFQDVLHALASVDGMQQVESTQQRALPNYYIRLKLAPPWMYDLKTNQSFATGRGYETEGYAEMVDNAGRVVFSTRKQERLTDTEMTNLVYRPEDRFQVLYGNVILELSKQFSSNIQFKHQKVSVVESDGKKVVFADPSGNLAIGQSVMIYRNALRLKDKTQIEVPLWEGFVESVENGRATASLSLPILQTSSVDVRAEDYTIVDAAGVSSNSLGITLCDTVTDKGALHLEKSAIQTLAASAAGQALSYPYYVGDMANDFTSRIQALTKTGFRGMAQVAAYTPTHCLEPLIKIAETKRDCRPDGTCDVKMDVSAGLRVMSGGQKVADSALKQTLSIDAVPAVSIDKIIERKTGNYLFDLFKQSAAKLKL